LTKVIQKYDKQISDQKASFEDLKKRRLEKQNELSKSEFILEKLKIYSEQEKIKYETINLDVQMQKEIDDYVQFNIAEMDRALDELKKSFEDEIEALDGIRLIYLEILFADVRNGLINDMNEELENLQFLYEEQRRVEVEKIRLKHKK
jgi:hypothetical protein